MGINLAFLLFMVAFNWHSGGPGLGLFTLALALFNAFLGFIFLLFEWLLLKLKRRRGTGYVGGFFLSFLLLLLIGFGMCARETRKQEVEAIEEPATTP